MLLNAEIYIPTLFIFLFQFNVFPFGGYEIWVKQTYIFYRFANICMCNSVGKMCTCFSCECQPKIYCTFYWNKSFLKHFIDKCMYQRNKWNAYIKESITRLITFLSNYILQNFKKNFKRKNKYIFSKYQHIIILC